MPTMALPGHPGLYSNQEFVTSVLRELSDLPLGLTGRLICLCDYLFMSNLLTRLHAA